jgi:CelD/BcsL family acetyltransferase involved in cellulose biosynthesis
MRVLRYTKLEDLSTLAEDWDRLAGGVPFRGWTWLSHWWRSYGPRNEMEAQRKSLAVLGLFDDGGSLVGVAPWFLERSARRGRVLKPLGMGEVCSDYLSLLCHPAREEAVVECLAEYLVESAKADEPDGLRWDLLELEGVDAEDRPIAALADALAIFNCTVHRRDGVICWRLDLPTSWESYVVSLGKNLRREVRRLERELLDSDRAKLHSVEKIDELPLAMDILIELHQRRRETLSEKGCFASERFLDFYRHVVPALLRQGQLQFHWLELDGKAIAAEFQLVGGGVLYAYQAGIDPGSMEYQPGKLINLSILKKSIAGGYRAFDFLRGDEPYKARFGAVARPSLEYRVVPHRPVAQLRHNLWLAENSVKAWVKGVGVRS